MCEGVQDVFSVVRASAGDFDAVCVATSLHKLGSMANSPRYAEAVVKRPEFAHVKRMLLGAHCPPPPAAAAALCVPCTGSYNLEHTCHDDVICTH